MKRQFVKMYQISLKCFFMVLDQFYKLQHFMIIFYFVLKKNLWHKIHDF